MDNPNDPNNSGSSSPPQTNFPYPPPVAQPEPTPISQPTPIDPGPTSLDTGQTWQPNAAPLPYQQVPPVQPEPVPTPEPPPAPAFDPLGGTAQAPQTWPQTPPPPVTPPSFDMNQTQNLPGFSEPPSTFQTSDPGTSTLDNPWGASLQPPPLDSGSTPQQPNPIESGPASDLPPISQNSLQGIQPESIPTDLSHLISGIPPQEPPPPIESGPANATSETLVVPPAPGPEIPTLPIETDHGGGIPKWVIGVGVGLLIVIAGASAYFILGIGQPPKTTSIPATQVPSTQQIKPPPPVATPVPTPSTATGSASFGALEGTKQATSSGSAFDTIRQRTQGK